MSINQLFEYVNDLLTEVAGYHYAFLLSSPHLPARVADVSIMIII
jgi:hypothetical protein